MNAKQRSINSLFAIGLGVLVTASMLVSPALLYGKTKEVGDVEEITLDELMNIEVTVASRSKEKAVEAPSWNLFMPTGISISISWYRPPLS